MQKYVLDDEGKPVAADLLTWAKWFENSDRERIVASDSLGGARVSTVFLGLDHRFTSGGDPILWETMIFGGPHHGYQERYTSRHEAELGHRIAVKLVIGDEL